MALCRVAVTPLSAKINLVNLGRKILEHVECGDARHAARKMKTRLTDAGNATRHAVTDGMARVSILKSPTAAMRVQNNSVMKT